MQIVSQIYLEKRKLCNPASVTLPLPPSIEQPAALHFRSSAQAIEAIPSRSPLGARRSRGRGLALPPCRPPAPGRCCAADPVWWPWLCAPVRERQLEFGLGLRFGLRSQEGKQQGDLPLD